MIGFIGCLYYNYTFYNSSYIELLLDNEFLSHCFNLEESLLSRILDLDLYSLELSILISTLSLSLSLSLSGCLNLGLN
jgi:hypothetical protein